MRKKPANTIADNKTQHRHWKSINIQHKTISQGSNKGQKEEKTNIRVYKYIVYTTEDDVCRINKTKRQIFKYAQEDNISGHK